MKTKTSKILNALNPFRAYNPEVNRIAREVIKEIREEIANEDILREERKAIETDNTIAYIESVLKTYPILN